MIDKCQPVYFFRKRCSFWRDNPTKFVNFVITCMGSNQSQIFSSLFPSYEKHGDRHDNDYVNFVRFVRTVVMIHFTIDGEMYFHFSFLR
jgi:hypothetical protein